MIIGSVVPATRSASLTGSESLANLCLVLRVAQQKLQIVGTSSGKRRV
jgi:hypothetical protein